MKNILSVLIIALLFVACKEEVKNEEMPAVNDEQVEELAYMSYGEEINAADAMDAMKLGEKYASMKTGDTITVKVKGQIMDVCEKMGCWIKLPVNETETAMVKFKDYGFFLPKNGKDKEVILSGKAYKTVTPVDELKHYAMDAGDSEEEIAKIIEDKVTLNFLADGALVEKFDNPDVAGIEKETEKSE